MSQNDIFSLCLLIGLLCSSAESCVQRHVQARVPQRLQAGYVVSKVNLVHCGMGHVYLTCSDPDFAVQTDGTILTSHVTTVPDDGKSFWIWVEDEAGETWKVDVSLSLADQVSQKSASEVLKRFKRRWRPLPFSITENDIGPFPKDVEFISSDSSSNYMVYYKIRGMGIDSDPMGVFSVNAETGLLQVLQTVDREQYPKFEFMAHVYNKQTNQESDKPLPITVNVQDVNDNAPQFSGPMLFYVEEHSRQGTVIGKVNATDKDEPNTLHTKIRYSLLNYIDLFVIDPESGILKTANNKLDRETQDKYFVKIDIKDMNGNSDGLSGQGVATVFLTDINDNPPTFKQSAYKVQVQENQANKLILRIPVDDMDIKETPNWNALYEITKGNESGNFWITTDPKTNEGLLYVTKPLDREKQDKINLEVTARNQVPLVGTSSSWQKLSVDVDVQDVDEGPEFSAPILWLKVKENVPNGTLIGTYTATDPETKSSNGIKYYKIPQSDPGSWISVMESTGELKTTNTIDRESSFVVNNTYNITVKAVDPSQKSGTGTVVILIQDVNDNIPMVPIADRIVCTKDGIRGSTLVEATDLDQTPYSAPFTFELSKDLAAKWKLKNVKDTSVVLEQAEDMPNGVYQVPLLIKDLQGVGQEQMVSVRICDCVSDGVCSARGVSARLGAWAILVMLLALLLGLLLCLLLLFVCTTKGEKLRMSDDDGSGGILIQSNTEAPGEEVKETPLLITPGSKMDVGDGSKGGGTLDYRTIGSLGGAFGQQQIVGGGSQGMYGTDQFGSSFHKYSDMATLDMWRSNEILLDNKLLYFGEEDDGRFAADVLKPYGYEGVGSPAGSVGCCSILSDHDALDFLDSLGPKFRTLADVCTSKRVTGGQ